MNKATWKMYKLGKHAVALTILSPLAETIIHWSELIQSTSLHLLIYWRNTHSATNKSAQRTKSKVLNRYANRSLRLCEIFLFLSFSPTITRGLIGSCLLSLFFASYARLSTKRLPIYFHLFLSDFPVHSTGASILLLRHEWFYTLN